MSLVLHIDPRDHLIQPKGISPSVFYTHVGELSTYKKATTTTSYSYLQLANVFLHRYPLVNSSGHWFD